MKIVAVLDDLFFMVKIMDAVKRAGVEVIFVKEDATVFELVKDQPVLIIIDLNIKTLDSVKLIRQLKQEPETKHIHLLGFVSHVQVELKKQALDAGADQVLPRSTFSASLPAILQRHAHALTDFSESSQSTSNRNPSPAANK